MSVNYQFFRNTTIVATSFAHFSVAQATLLLSPEDDILGGRYDGVSALVQGAEGGNPGNTWPGAEPPADLINGKFGGGGEKFLLFSPGQNAGVIITPQAGASVVKKMTMWVANDAPARTPLTYELLGTNETITDGGPGTVYNVSDFTLISSGDTGLSNGINTATTDIGDDPSAWTGDLNTVSFDNSDSYTSYMLYFPTNGGDGLFQLSEVAFEGTLAGVPEPGSTSLLAISLGALFLRRKR